MQYGDLKAVLSRELLEKYDRFAVIACLRADNTTRWCPHPGCENVYVGELPDPSNPQVVCTDCGEPFCYNCKDVWHEGKSCMQYMMENSITDKKTKKWMKR